MPPMSAEARVKVSWLVNVVLVPVCSFFLVQTYRALISVQDMQTEMRVEQAKQGEQILGLRVQVNRIESKVDEN